MPPRQDTVDRQPGSLPLIRSDVRGLTFEMHPLDVRHDEGLTIRCDYTGDVWIFIQCDADTP